MKININNLNKHYEKLTTEERARLMINARIREDKSEIQKLVASAKVKRFDIRADSEGDMCNAWVDIHETLIMLSLPVKIREIACISCGLGYIYKNDWEKTEEMEERTFHHNQQRNSYYQAFIDWLETHSLPIDREWLRAFNIDITEFEKSKPDEIRKLEDYTESTKVFNHIWSKVVKNRK